MSKKNVVPTKHQREPGRATSFAFADALNMGQGPSTCYLTCLFSDSCQNFGGSFMKDDTLKAYTEELFKVLGVPDADALKAAPVEIYALRNIDSWNASIVGIENAKTRKRFIAHEFFRRRGIKLVSAYDEERERRTTAVRNAMRRLEDSIESLTLLDEQFIDWTQDNRPPPTPIPGPGRLVTYP